MKALAIALGAVCALLVYALVQRGTSANAQVESLATNQVALSNQVAEVRTRMTLAQVKSAQALTNLQRNLDKRTSDLNVISNRLVQTHLLLQSAQKDARAVQEQFQGKVARVAVLETENDQLKQRASRPVESEISSREKATLRRQLAEVSRERDALQTRLGAVQVEKEGFQAQLFDLEFLERQTRDAEVAADIRRRMASSRAGTAPDPRMKLELQPDGTVRYIELKR